MRVTDVFTDDRMPCVEFEHNGFRFELLWTSEKIIGRLDMVQEDGVELSAALKKYPELLAIINDPLNENHSDFDRIGEVGQYEYSTAYGYVTVVGMDVRPVD